MWPLRSLVLCFPSRWQHAARQLPPTKILPLELGGTKDQAYAAWIGDKILGAAVVGGLQKTHQKFDRASATKLTGVALANWFMAANIEVILPGYGDRARLLSERGVGTMVEAAVAEVHATDADAVVDLAVWLVQQAADTPNPDAKSHLLNLGGSVMATHASGLDHEPTFRAIAKLGELSASSEGTSKKKAEQKAADMLLGKLGVVKFGCAANRETVTMERVLDQWIPTEVFDAAVELKGETLQEWWFRGAWNPKKSFRRAQMAPMVFPEHILAVDIWSRRTKPATSGGKSSATFAVITSKSAHDCTPVFEAPSMNSARKMLGVEANKLISEIASIN